MSNLSSSDISSESDFSSSVDGTSSPESQDILSSINRLLAQVGIFEKKISTVKEVKRQASSMFVAIYEALFHISLDGIVRQPRGSADFNGNAQIVIDALSRRINKPLAHINGEDIARGDLDQISNLVNIFTLYISKSFAHNNDWPEQISNHHPNIRSKGAVKDRSRSLSSDGGLGGPNSNNSTNFDNKNQHKSEYIMYDHHHHQTSSREKARSAGAHISPYIGGVRANIVKRSAAHGQFAGGQLHSSSSANRMSAIANSKELASIIKSHESLMKQNEKLEDAKRRREDVLLQRGKFVRSYNSKHQNKVNTILRNKNKQDYTRRNKSTKMRQESEEYAMLRRIYGGFLGKLRQWYWDEDIEIREREERSKKELVEQMSSLKTVFRDRMDIMRESMENKRSLEKDSMADLRRYEGAFKRLIKSEYEKIIQRYANQKDQFIEYQENRRLEGYRNLLDMLQVEKWHDKLRH